MSRDGMNTRDRRQLLGKVDHLRDLIEKRETEESRALLGEILATARSLGIEKSAHMTWSLAVIHDYLGELEMAYRYACEAVQADPLALPFQGSFEIIIDRIRRALADPGLSVEDPSTPRLYEILVGEGEADPEAHLAMARHLLAKGELERGERLVEALAVLHPTSAAVWRLKAQLARTRGDADLSARCEAEAAGCTGGGMVPFAVPGMARS